MKRDWYRVQLKCAAHGNALDHHLIVKAESENHARTVAESMLKQDVVATAEVTFEVEGDDPQHG